MCREWVWFDRLTTNEKGRLAAGGCGSPFGRLRRLTTNGKRVGLCRERDELGAG